MTNKNYSFSNLVSICLLLVSLTAAFFVVSKTFRVKAVARAEANASVDVQKQYVTKNIEDIRVGERTLGTNPQGLVDDELDDSIFETVPFCKYSLHTFKEDGSQCDIQLLRTANWLDEEITRLRRKIDGKVVDEVDLLTDSLLLGELDSRDNYALDVWLELPEMGVVSWATLTNVDEKVDVHEGAGNVVTGTFAHIADDAVDLVVEDQAESIGCTDNHPFWSVDRQVFIPAGELIEGERLLLYNGETKRVVQKLPRPGPQVVYNLEIYGEHVYHVSSDGVLVHNNCNVFERYVSEEEALESVGRQKLVLRRDKNGSYKNIAEIGSVNPKKLGKRSSYEYRLLIETKNDPRKRFTERGIEGADGHSNSWHIEAERLEEFNRKFVRRITMEKRPQVNARKRKK
ncbi:MAG: hypothetical protein J6X44_09030 [Thermoguttaceae bacterium]|nr:hypothetical protein [Thermoguttaceae bacterium]